MAENIGNFQLASALVLPGPVRAFVPPALAACTEAADDETALNACERIARGTGARDEDRREALLSAVRRLIAMGQPERALEFAEMTPLTRVPGAQGRALGEAWLALGDHMMAELELGLLVEAGDDSPDLVELWERALAGLRAEAGR